MRPMSKRIAAAVLWFAVGWYAGAYLAFYLGIADVIGPILGITAAMLFAGDPLKVIWPSRQEAAGIVEALPERPSDSLPKAA